MSTQQPNNIPPVTQPEVDVTPADVTQVTTETPAVVETTAEVPTSEVQADATMNAEAQAAGVTPEQQAQLDNQVVDTVATAIAEDRITARDIMTAVLSDSLGISPSASGSLIDLLMSDMFNDTQSTQVTPDIMQVDTTQQEPPVV